VTSSWRAKRGRIVTEAPPGVAPLFVVLEISIFAYNDVMGKPAPRTVVPMPSVDARRRDWLRTVGLAAAASAGAAPARAQPPTHAPADDRPFEWPEITLLDGTVWTPESWHGLAGVAVVWATWCAYCHRHNPHVEKLHRAVRGRPVRVLGVALDRDPEAVRRHVRERGYTFPMTVGPESLLARLVPRRVTPTTVSFDRRGRLLQRIPGEMFEDDVLALARLADGPA
jgi:thiol-disulfide isomerase/thioredoxin